MKHLSLVALAVVGAVLWPSGVSAQCLPGYAAIGCPPPLRPGTVVPGPPPTPTAAPQSTAPAPPLAPPISQKTTVVEGCTYINPRIPFTPVIVPPALPECPNECIEDDLEWRKKHFTLVEIIKQDHDVIDGLRRKMRGEGIPADFFANENARHVFMCGISAQLNFTLEEVDRLEKTR